MVVLVPALATSKQVVTPELSSISIVILKVTVVEELSCDSMEHFEIRVTIAKERRRISSVTIPYVDGGVVVFSSIPQGEYNCTTAVVLGDRMVASTVISCPLLGKPILQGWLINVQYMRIQC